MEAFPEKEASPGNGSFSRETSTRPETGYFLDIQRQTNQSNKTDMPRKKLLLLYLILLAIALATLIALRPFRRAADRAPQLPRDYPAISQEGILRLVTEYNQSGYYIAGDTIEGFQYELGRAIADQSGLEIQTALEMNLPESFRMLDEGRVDIVARNIPVNSEIREKYLFTEPIVLNKQVLVQRSAEANGGVEPLRNQLELAGKTIYVPKDSPALVRLRNLEHEIGDTIYVTEDDLYSSEQLAIMVAKGDIDFAVCDQRIATESARRLRELDVQTDISFTQLQAWAVRHDAPALRDSLNAWLGRLRENGAFEKIYRKYYGKKK